MITLITGAPGSGKTAALVELLSGFGGRSIYADGIPELTLQHEVLTDARQWMTTVADGSAVVIDEVQRVWRPAGTGSRIPPDIEALETHRHRGLDFFIVTQHPNLVHANVRRLVGRHVHLRDIGMLGRWWYEWPEATNPETFRTAPVKKRYSLPKAAFAKYKSASLHIKPIRSVPRSLVVLGVAVLALGIGAWRVYVSIAGKVAPTPAAVAAKAPGGVVGHPGGTVAPMVGPSIVWPVYDSALPVEREPYAARALVLEGSWQVGAREYGLFGMVSGGRRVASVSLDQLVKAGYRWTSLAPCSGVLAWRGIERPVSCGLPAAGAGADERGEVRAVPVAAAASVPMPS